MNRKLVAAMIAAALGAGAPAQAAEPAYLRIDPSRFQSFVGNWTPEDAPLCAVIRSEAEWRQILHPAPVMDSHKPFSPGGKFWKGHAVIMVARVISAGNIAGVFRPERIRRSAEAIEVDYRFSPTPRASSSIKWYLALRVAEPLPPTVSLVENGREVCALHQDAGTWVTPAPRTAE
ncbi:MAG TPA: hypothetical protein VII63_00610 [Caulobacteraceae bacterium]